EPRNKRSEEVKVLLEISAQQKVLFHLRSRPAPHLLSKAAILHYFHVPIRSLRNGRYEESIDSIIDLAANPANAPSDHGSSLPHRFRHREAESFAQRLLQHHRRATLKAIHQRRVVAAGQHEDAVFTATREGVVNPGALGVVGRNVSEEHERGVHLLPGEAEGLD